MRLPLAQAGSHAIPRIHHRGRVKGMLRVDRPGSPPGLRRSEGSVPMGRSGRCRQAGGGDCVLDRRSLGRYWCASTPRREPFHPQPRLHHTQGSQIQDFRPSPTPGKDLCSQAIASRARSWRWSPEGRGIAEAKVAPSSLLWSLSKRWPGLCTRELNPQDALCLLESELCSPL